MGGLFSSLYSKYLVNITKNRGRFEEFDSKHKSESDEEIFNTYWNLEVKETPYLSGSQEQIKLERKSNFYSLPEELKYVID